MDKIVSNCQTLAKKMSRGAPVVELGAALSAPQGKGSSEQEWIIHDPDKTDKELALDAIRST